MIKTILEGKNAKIDLDSGINNLKNLYNTIKIIPKNILDELSESQKILKISKNMIIDPDLLVVFNPSNNNDYVFVYNNYSIIDK